MGQYYEEDEIKCAMFELLIKDLKYDLNKRFCNSINSSQIYKIERNFILEIDKN